jgi:hypothetical protein
MRLVYLLGNFGNLIRDWGHQHALVSGDAERIDAFSHQMITGIRETDENFRTGVEN